MIQWPKSNDVLGTTNRGNPAESGLCTLCRSDCAGKCETWMSCLKGRHMLYPRDFGSVTAGSSNTCHIGVSYNSLRIQGYSYGANGVAPAGPPTPTTASSPTSPWRPPSAPRKRPRFACRS